MKKIFLWFYLCYYDYYNLNAFLYNELCFNIKTYRIKSLSEE